MKLRFAFSTFLILLTTYSFSQDTLYYDRNDAEVNSIKKAYTYSIFQTDPTNKEKGILRHYFKNGKPKSTVNLVKSPTFITPKIKRLFETPLNLSDMASFYIEKMKNKWMYDGKYEEWYINGQLKKQIDYQNGLMNNMLLTYWPDGTIKRKERFNSSYSTIEQKRYNRFGERERYELYIKGRQLSKYTFKCRLNNIINGIDLSKLSNPNYCAKLSAALIINKFGEYSKINLFNSTDPKLAEQIDKLLKERDCWGESVKCDGEAVPFTYIFEFVINKPQIALDILKNANGKDTLYFDHNGFLLPDKTNTDFIELFATTEENPEILIHKSFYNNGLIKSESTVNKKETLKLLKDEYDKLKIKKDVSSKKEKNEQECYNINIGISTRDLIYSNLVKTGKTTLWNENGKLKCELNFNSNLLDGMQKFYTPNDDNVNQIVFNTGLIEKGTLKKEDSLSITDIVEKNKLLKELSIICSSEIMNAVFTDTDEKILQEKKGTIGGRFHIYDYGCVTNLEIINTNKSMNDKQLESIITKINKRLINNVFWFWSSFEISTWHTFPFIFEELTSKSNKLKKKQNITSHQTRNKKQSSI